MKVVFDVGKVLAKAHMQWKDVITASGLDRPIENLPFQYLYDLPEYLPYEGGQVSEGEYLKAVADSFGLSGIDEARHLHRSVIGEEYPGVEEIINELNAQGIETATLSNNNPIHWAWFTTSGKYPAIEKIKYPIASFHLGYFKPDLRIYAAFCEKLGWNANDIIFLDDSEKNVLAAIEAGWNSVVITEDEPKSDQIRRALNLS